MNKKQQQCLNCGGKDFKHYDGMLGYEAGICLTCGMIHDFYGSHEAETDPHSNMYVSVDHKALAVIKQMRDNAPVLFNALKEALQVLNEIPNTEIRHERFKDSYQACSHFSNLIRNIESAK